MTALPHPDALPFADYEQPRAAWNRIMVVGEAPGAEEVKQGRPFCGRSGQLLDKALAQAGIAREASYIANVFRRQPPGNKVDHFFASRRAAALAGMDLAEDLGPMSGKLCLAVFVPEGPAHLAATIKKLKPAALLAVGRTPLWALTGLSGITAAAGTTQPCRFAPAIPVIATYHPSFILRGNWGLMDEWTGHMQAALRAAA